MTLRMYSIWMLRVISCYHFFCYLRKGCFSPPPDWLLYITVSHLQHRNLPAQILFCLFCLVRFKLPIATARRASRWLAGYSAPKGKLDGATRARQENRSKDVPFPAAHSKWAPVWETVGTGGGGEELRCGSGKITGSLAPWNVLK